MQAHEGSPVCSAVLGRRMGLGLWGLMGAWGESTSLSCLGLPVHLNRAWRLSAVTIWGGGESQKSQPKFKFP